MRRVDFNEKRNKVEMEANILAVANNIKQETAEEFVCVLPPPQLDKETMIVSRINMECNDDNNNRNYICLLCGKESRTQKLAHGHSLCHQERKVCPICKKSYTPRSFSQHTKIHKRKEEQRNFMCQVYQKSYFSKNDLNSHLAHHTKPVECDFCGKRFAKKYQITLHWKNHQSPLQFQYEKCCKSFRRFENLQNHFNLIHKSIKKHYQCDQCPKKSKGKSTITKHLLTHAKVSEASDHKTVNKSRTRLRAASKCCMQSNFKTFSTRQKNMEKSKEKHAKEQKGAIAPKEIKSAFQMRQRTLQNSKLIKCKIYDETIATTEKHCLKNQIYLDLVKSGGKSEACEKELGRKVQLKKHKAMYPSYQCDKCSKTFKRKLKLVQHIKRTHSSESFKESSCVQATISIQRFGCARCDGRFITFQQLKNHLKQYENIKCGLDLMTLSKS